MTVNVLRFREDVGLDDLKSTLERLLELAGCPSCGLNGFDVRLEADSRVRFEPLRKVNALVDVEVLPFDHHQLERFGGMPSWRQ